MIEVTIDTGAFADAMQRLPAILARRMRTGLDATLDSVAARARSNHPGWVARSGALDASTQNAGIAQDGGELTGVVAFSAKSKSTAKNPGGYLYGLVQEFGTKDGRVKGTRFIRNAIDAQDSQLLQDSLEAALKDAGFSVT